MLLFFHLIFQSVTPDNSSMINKAANERMSTSQLHYLIREPETNNGTSKAIILLHGVGSNEQDLFGLADQLPSDFYILSVRAPFSLGAGKFAWYNVDFSSGKPVFDSQQELSSREMLTELVLEVKQAYNLHEVYLGGFSQGAIMSYSVGLSHPKDVTGVIGFSGRILEEIKSSISATNDLTKLRIFLAHGVQDDKLPIHYAKEGRSYLEKLRVKLSYHEYQMGHQINGVVLKDLNSWLVN